MQWYRNGEPIPGATQVSYTTEAITAANATNVYSLEILGCEMSSEVQAVIFTPSTTKSIGINFIGGGANGAPTEMLTNDIAGLHPQAYWVNAPDVGSGGLSSELVDSDNQPSTVVVEWTTSGTWGSGTGEGTATQRLLNGLVYDNPGGDPANTPSTAFLLAITPHCYFVGIPLNSKTRTTRSLGRIADDQRACDELDNTTPLPDSTGVSTNATTALRTYVRSTIHARRSGTVFCKGLAYNGFDAAPR